MHFNAAVPQISPSMGHIIPFFFFFYSTLALECGEVGGEAIFKIRLSLKQTTNHLMNVFGGMYQFLR
jgi:hypothetical protein